MILSIEILDVAKLRKKIFGVFRNRSRSWKTFFFRSRSRVSESKNVTRRTLAPAMMIWKITNKYSFRSLFDAVRNTAVYNEVYLYLRIYIWVYPPEITRSIRKFFFNLMKFLQLIELVLLIILVKKKFDFCLHLPCKTCKILFFLFAIFSKKIVFFFKKLDNALW